MSCPSKSPNKNVFAWIRFKIFSNSIRVRLFVASVLLVTLITVIFIVINIDIGIKNGQQQAIDKLESVAILKEAELNNWASGLRSDLAAVIINDEELSHALELLDPSGDPAAYQNAYKKLYQRFTQTIQKTRRMEEIFLMNSQKQVVLSTDHWRERGYGTSETDVYFSKALTGDYLHPPSYTLSVGGIAIIVARPLMNDQGQTMGVLVGRTTPETLSEIMLERAGLGETGETYLVNSSHIMLTEPRFSEPRWYNVYYVFTDGAKAAIEGHQNGYGIYENYNKVRVLGVYRWLPELGVALLAEQDKTEAMAPTITTLTITGITAVVSAFFAGFLALLLAGTITEPLASLAKTAKQVTDGDLQQVAVVVRQDEIGILAEAFNRMTEQLRDLINNLEHQVVERTKSLEWQTLKLETSAKVSQEITSILDTEELLTSVVELIQQAFSYYHVAVYLVNEGTDQLVFMAGTGEVSQHWKTWGRRLPIEAGNLYGQVVRNNNAALINDIAQDARFNGEIDLPDTKSTLVVPLRIRDWVLGILVVQSTEKNTFQKEDVKIIQSLGDQVAIAIENSHLYNRVRKLAALEERQRLARELHDYVTQSLYGLVLFSGAAIRTLDTNEIQTTRQYMLKIAHTANMVLKEMRLLLYQLRKTEMDSESLLETLRQRIEMVEERLGIETQITVEGNITMQTPVEICLCGIVQEALNNALRHSEAKKIDIIIHEANEWVKLEVIDNGVGFDVKNSSNQGGLGFLGMQERAQKIGGSLEIEAKPGYGTRVCITVPKANPDGIHG